MGPYNAATKGCNRLRWLQYIKMFPGFTDAVVIRFETDNAGPWIMHWCVNFWFTVKFSIMNF